MLTFKACPLFKCELKFLMKFCCLQVSFTKLSRKVKIEREGFYIYSLEFEYTIYCSLLCKGVKEKSHVF